MTLRDFSRSQPILRAHGITETQWRVLRALTTADAVRISQLAQLTLISGPSLTRILKSLEDRRLLERTAEPDDQRAARITITPAGRALIETVAPHSEARYRGLAKRIGEADLDTLYRLLADLPERLERTRR